MTTANELISTGIETLETEVKEIMECLHEVLASGPQAELADSLPWISKPKESPEKEDPIKTAQIYSIAFQLLDMIEEQVAQETRRKREKLLGAEEEKGLWPHCLKSLKADGFTESEIAEAIQTVRVEPVFTAHPTEAKRASVRERHRDIYDQLQRLEDPNFTAQEHDRAKSDLLAALEALWTTGEIHVERPTIERELRNALFYLREAFPETIERLDRHLNWAWKDAGFSPETLSEAGGGPKVRFGLWIGGDRDGHPFVTAKVTRQTLAELRRQAVKLYRRELANAAYHLTVSAPQMPAPEDFQNRMETIVSTLGDEGYEIRERNYEEPWRGFLYLLRAQIEKEADADTFSADLEMLEQSLIEIGAERLAERYVTPLRRKFEVFGFHLAELDVRQNSGFHDKGTAQLLAAAGIARGADFADWPETERVEFLTNELKSPRPFLHPDQSAGDEADAIRDCYQVLSDQLKEYGAGIGSLIVSMTRQLSDLLVVHLFMRETGLGRDGLPQVVPLFETLDDLKNAAGIVNAYLSHPIASGNTTGSQQIMLGYSDSNKDGGILASQWALQTSQSEIAEIAKKHNTTIRFFHGRGGTVSRGAGPTNWFVRVLPHGTLNGDYRMTEQGETIARKYAYPDNAAYHLESLAACVTRTTTRHRRAESSEDPGIDLMPGLAANSREAYRELLESEGFIEFYRQATPIDALEQTQMGSRPSRRTGTASLDDLRAIPWVFSWTQARFYLPGWFGVGTALETLRTETPDDFARLADTIEESTFPRYVFTGVETNLISANWELMQAYGSLVQDAGLRESFMSKFENELTLARENLARLFPTPINERRPRYSKTLTIREAPLRTLHLQQVELLRAWRKTGEPITRDLIFSISAIASGLRTTG